MNILNVRLCRDPPITSNFTQRYYVQIYDAINTDSMASLEQFGSGQANTCPDWKLPTVPEIKILQGEVSISRSVYEKAKPKNDHILFSLYLTPFPTFQFHPFC